MSAALFDGKTYDASVDEERLGTQLGRVATLMLDGEWRTLAEIQEETGGSLPAVSARLRDLRKDKFGAHTVERRHRGAPVDGLYEYRVLPPAGAIPLSAPKKNPFFEGLMRAAKVVLAADPTFKGTPGAIALRKEIEKIARR